MRALWWCLLGGCAWNVAFSLTLDGHLPQPWVIGCSVLAGVVGTLVTALAIDRWKSYESDDG